MARAEERVAFSESSIRSAVNTWLRNEKWKLENFSEILELIGLKMPVLLKNWNEDESSFECVTGDGESVKLELFIGDGFERGSEITVRSENKSEVFSLCFNTMSKNARPQTKTVKRILKQGSKTLVSTYYMFITSRMLDLGKYSLTVDIAENNIELDAPKQIDDNLEAIEEYLLSLNSNLVIEDVYNTIVSLLNFPQYKLDKIKIRINFKETNSNLTRGCVIVEEGVLRQFASWDYENKETVHVYSDGDWEFISSNRILGVDRMIIKYDHQKKKYSISMEISDRETHFTLQSALTYAKLKVAQTQKSF